MTDSGSARKDNLPQLTVAGGVSAVVVNYNAGELLMGCVASLLRSGANEVIIVDNASSDSSVADCLAGIRGSDASSVAVIQTGANLGYGRAANRGAARAEFRFLVVCNPDCQCDDDTLLQLAHFLDEHPGAGMVGPRIVDSQGVTYPSPRRFPSLVNSAAHASLGQLLPNNRFSRHYKSVESAELGTDRWISGAFLMLSREVFLEIGGFDPDFFMFMEDVDLSRRIIERNQEIGFVDTARVTHRQGHSSLSRPYLVIFAHHRSLWIYSKKTLRGVRRALLPLVALGIALRLAISVARAIASGRRG